MRSIGLDRRGYRAPCRFVWNATFSFHHVLREQMSLLMLEPGQPQVGYGDEFLARAEALRSAFDLLQQAVHGFDEWRAAQSL